MSRQKNFQRCSSRAIVTETRETVNRALRHSIIHQQVGVMARTYSEERSLVESLFYADLAYNDLTDLTASGCNNVGYVFFSSGDNSKARILFDEEAVRRRKKVPKQLLNTAIAALLIHNLAMIEIRSNELLGAAKLLKDCLSELRAGSEAEMECRCLFIPKNINGHIVLEETFENPELSETASLALATISQVLQ